MTRLLLFTNEYPYRTGDAVFVATEIDALRERFDDIVVFCHARDTSAGLLDLPEGVRLGGNLFDPAPEDAPRQLLEWGALGLFLQAAWREFWSGRLLRHPVYFTLAAKVGITQAHREAVRAAISDADDVVAYGYWGMGGGLAVPWLRGVRARVTRLHRYDLYEETSPEGYLPFRPFLMARADRLLAISDDGCRYIAQRFRSARGKIAVSRLGAAGPAGFVRPEPGPVRTVVSASYLTEIKRVGLLLDALRVLPHLDEAHPVRWVHFGDGPLMPALREALRDLPPGLTVELRGQTAHDRILEFYATERVDVFANVSSSEGVPVSIMEAIAYGIPVVATAVGGTPEIVGEHLGTGRTVAPDAAAPTIAEALADVLSASDDAYAPRELWQREYDVGRTSARAAELVFTAGRAVR